MKLCTFVQKMDALRTKALHDAVLERIIKQIKSDKAFEFSDYNKELLSALENSLETKGYSVVLHGDSLYVHTNPYTLYDYLENKISLKTGEKKC